MLCYATEKMTCVDRYVGSALQVGGYAFQFAVYRDELFGNLYVTADWCESRSVSIGSMLRCLVDGTYYSFSTVSGWEDPVCVIPCSAEPDTSALVPVSSSSRITLHSTGYTSYAFRTGTFLTLPKFTRPDVTLYGNYSQKVEWTLVPGDNRRGWVSSMEIRYRDPGETAFDAIAVFTDTLHTYRYLTTDSTIVGKEACLMLEYRTYSADWNGQDLEDFETLNRSVTPVQYVERDASVPLAPGGISVSMLLAGGKVTVQWDSVTDPLNTIASYRLERAVAGRGGAADQFVQLYSGTSAQFRDILPDGAASAAYRVCTVNSQGTRSPWTETGVMEVAQSNLYVGRSGSWVRAAGVWIGEKRASPMLKVGGG